jgi:hypothetical protein
MKRKAGKLEECTGGALESPMKRKAGDEVGDPTEQTLGHWFKEGNPELTGRWIPKGNAEFVMRLKAEKFKKKPLVGKCRAARLRGKGILPICADDHDGDAPQTFQLIENCAWAGATALPDLDRLYRLHKDRNAKQPKYVPFDQYDKVITQQVLHNCNSSCGLTTSI